MPPFTTNSPMPVPVEQVASENKSHFELLALEIRLVPGKEPIVRAEIAAGEIVNGSFVEQTRLPKEARGDEVTAVIAANQALYGETKSKLYEVLQKFGWLTDGTVS